MQCYLMYLGAFFLSEQDEEMPLDSLLVYREHYRRVRDSLAGAILSDSIDELEASLEVIFLIVLWKIPNPEPEPEPE